MKLVLVHGRAQGGKDPVELQASWLAALERGLQANGLALPAGLEVEFPYYGDLLDDLVEQLGDPLDDRAITKGGAATAAYDAEMEFRAELLWDFAQACDLTQAEIEAEQTQQALEKGPQNWALVRALAAALDKTPAGGAVLNCFTRDVAVYLKYSGIRKRVDAAVAAAFTPDPCVVVAHSLGTVITYNVLSEAKALDIRKLVTLGAPLGIRSIRRALGTLSFPWTVRDWYNGRDPVDIVALFPLDGEHFPVDPAVRNDSKIRNSDRGDHHWIEDYLSNPAVAQEIGRALSTSH